MKPRRLLRQGLEHRRRLGDGLETNGLRLRLGFGLRFGNRRDRRLLTLLEELGNMLDRLLLWLDRLRRRRSLGLALFGLALRRLGRAEELREWTLTHARAATRH